MRAARPLQPAKPKRQRRPDTRAEQDPLELLGVAPAAVRILRYFALRPGAEPHTRYLQRLLGIGGASVQRELERLTTLRALERFRVGRFVRYRMSPESPLWTAIRIMIGATPDPVALVRDALCDVSGIHVAFVYGSTAANTRRKDSDVDVFVMEDPDVDGKALHRQLAEAGMLMQCEVNTVRYTPQALAERLHDPRHASSRFVRDVLVGPKEWIVGDGTRLLPLATAAGIRMSDVPKRAS